MAERRKYLGLIEPGMVLTAPDNDVPRFRYGVSEKSAWDIVSPKLKDTVYGSEEYKATLRDIKPMVKHHYEMNDHHPEHFEDGIAGMSLMGLIEMLCDWKAASERGPGNSLARSFDHNKERWGYSDELDSILRNTAKELNLI